MFGMSSTQFWEEDPQLYWAYRISYLKNEKTKAKQQAELMKYQIWLNGNIACIATQIAIGNCFSKKKTDFPSFEKMFNKNENKHEIKELADKMKQEEDKDIRQQIEFNYWARL